MWRTHTGDRVLTEAEWACFQIGVERLWDAIEEDIDLQTDHVESAVSVFDQLTAEQKLALLADTTDALRDPERPMPHHTAANEGAIAAVFSMIQLCLEEEIYLQLEEIDNALEYDPTEVRRLIRSVLTESDEPSDLTPEEDSTETQEWAYGLETFLERILWDTDFAMGGVFLDLPPEDARAQLDLYGIDYDYYLAIPEEPNKAGLIAARQILARLLDRPIPDDDGLYPTLEDLYNHLDVGPCSPEQIQQWENHPWIFLVAMPDPEWDCDCQTWIEEFSAALPREPFQLDSAEPLPPGELPDGTRIERLGEAWVVRDDSGYYWCGLVECGWIVSPDDEAMPPLSFPTEEAARSSYLRASQMYDARDCRHEEAMGRLGLSEA